MKSILVVVEVLIPSLYIDIINPLLSLAKKNIIRLQIKHVSDISIKEKIDTDIIVFCRSQSELCYSIFLEAKKQGIYVIYDIDDNFLEIPTSLELGAYHQNYKRLYVMLQFFKHADRVTVYSEQLYNQVKPYTSNVTLQKTYFDYSLISDRNRNRNSKKIKIAYASGRSPSGEVDAALENAIAKISETYRDRIEIHFWRELPKSLEKSGNVIRNQQVPNYNAFISDFYEQGFDIGLAPLIEDVFYMSKTNNKYREYGACNVAGVYSDVSLYNKCISNGENGLLVNNTEDDWFDAIEKLIVDNKLRREIALNANRDILDNYNFESFVSSWISLLNFDSTSRGPLEIKNVLNSFIAKSSYSLSKASNSNLCLLSEKLAFKFFNFELSYVGNAIDWNKEILYIICNDERGIYSLVKQFNENKKRLEGKFIVLDTLSLSDCQDIESLKHCIPNDCDLLIINDTFLKERIDASIFLNRASNNLGVNSVGYIALEMKSILLQSKPELVIITNKLMIIIEYMKVYWVKSSRFLSLRKVWLRIKAKRALYQLKSDINGIRRP